MSLYLLSREKKGMGQCIVSRSGIALRMRVMSHHLALFQYETRSFPFWWGRGRVMGGGIGSCVERKATELLFHRWPKLSHDVTQNRYHGS